MMHDKPHTLMNLNSIIRQLSQQPVKQSIQLPIWAFFLLCSPIISADEIIDDLNKNNASNKAPILTTDHVLNDLPIQLSVSESTVPLPAGEKINSDLGSKQSKLINQSNQSNQSNNDSLEKINRPIFKFNQKLDEWIFKPVAKTYQKITPTPVRKMVDNFFGNVDDVYSTANHLLQGNISQAIEGTTRVMINSVIGLGGVMDIATPVNLVKKPQDFGQTLGKWGVPSGPYLVMPILGPATVRDAVGKIATMQAPATGAMNDGNKILYTTAQIVNIRANLLSTTDLLDKIALDPYIMSREAYLQRKMREDRQRKSQNYRDDDTSKSPQLMNTQQSDLMKISATQPSSSMLETATMPTTTPIMQSQPPARFEQNDELDDGFIVP